MLVVVIAVIEESEADRRFVLRREVLPGWSMSKKRWHEARGALRRRAMRRFLRSPGLRELSTPRCRACPGCPARRLGKPNSLPHAHPDVEPPRGAGALELRLGSSSCPIAKVHHPRDLEQWTQEAGGAGTSPGEAACSARRRARPEAPAGSPAIPASRATVKRPSRPRLGSRNGSTRKGCDHLRLGRTIYFNFAKFRNEFPSRLILVHPVELIGVLVVDRCSA